MISDVENSCTVLFQDKEMEIFPNQDKFQVYVMAKRYEPMLLNELDAMVARFRLAHGTLKFWKSRMDDNFSQDTPLCTFREACNAWLFEDSPDVEAYFKHLELPDDRVIPEDVTDEKGR